MMTTTKERPILFSGPMVRAILEGRKTQTRRMVKLPESIGEDYGAALWSVAKRPKPWDASDWAFVDLAHPTDSYPWGVRCPYGRPGDLLWVRETFESVQMRTASRMSLWGVLYAADGKFRSLPQAHTLREGTIPSIHMPRWASRITLRLTDVRVARLQEIKLEECADEGAPPTHPADNMWDSVDTFKELWDARHKQPYQWSANPWVWVLTHKRVKGAE